MQFYPSQEGHRTQMTGDAREQKYNVLTFNYEQLKTKFDPIYRAVWCTLKSPAFTITLLKNIRSLQDEIAKFTFENPNNLPKYIIWESENPNIFSLGLDLGLIFNLILEKDEKGLERYLQACIDVFYINLMKLDISPLITISYLRGKVLGGGFEAALSSDIIVAESNVRCCFPEVRYNLLPSLGTLKMLLRRFSPNIIEPLLFEGKLINSEQLVQFGFIEKVIEVDEGRGFIQQKIEQIHPKHELMANLYKTKTLNTAITYDELDEFKRMWINAALHLNENNLKRLGRLALAQKRLVVK